MKIKNNLLLLITLIVLLQSTQAKKTKKPSSQRKPTDHSIANETNENTSVIVIYEPNIESESLFDSVRQKLASLGALSVISLVFLFFAGKVYFSLEADNGKYQRASELIKQQQKNLIQTSTIKGQQVEEKIQQIKTKKFIIKQCKNQTLDEEVILEILSIRKRRDDLFELILKGVSGNGVTQFRGLMHFTGKGYFYYLTRIIPLKNKIVSKIHKSKVIVYQVQTQSLLSAHGKWCYQDQQKLTGEWTLNISSFQ